jgi:hypothetical protein
MTAPDRIQITHQPRTMTTPDFRALCVELLQAWQLGDDIAGPMNRARTALKAEPEGEGPRPRGDWFTVAMIAQDMRSRGLAEQVAGEELLKLANGKHGLGNLGRPATSPASEPEGKRPSDQELYDLAAEFDGDPVPAMRRALEVWGNPLQGAPEPGENLATPPAPGPGEVGEVDPDHANRLGTIIPSDILQLADRLDRDGLRLIEVGYATESLPTRDTGLRVVRASYTLQQQQAELAALRDAPHPTFQDAIKLAQGCHDYSGGHSGTEGEAWHGAIDTVVAALKRAAIKPWDCQLKAVYGIGVEAHAGDVAVSVAELDDQHREAVHQAVAEALGGAHDCLRAWSAWSYGTMGPDDFVLVAEDSDRVAEIADAAIEAIRAIPLPAPQAGEVEA